MIKGIGVDVVDVSRRPAICVRDGALRACLEKQGIASIHVSISHEKTVCVALVVLS
jgi:phosphopantetheinyl transferase (holo-ACP synthase)